MVIIINLYKKTKLKKEYPLFMSFKFVLFDFRIVYNIFNKPDVFL